MSTRGFRHGRADEDFADEIRAHLALETDRLIADGMDPDQARLAARRHFGSTAAAGERYYESRRWMWIDHARQDLRDAVRSLRRQPVAAAVAVLSLAAGMAVTAATLTIRQIVFHNPPPAYANPGELSEIRVARGTDPILPIGSYAPGGLVGVWIAALGPSTIAAARPPEGVRDVRTGDRTEAVSVRAVTAELFDLLGVRPVVGHTFATGGATEGAGTPAMLSYRFWQQWFDGRPDVVGRPVWIENRPHVIVGVLPRDFWMSSMQSSVWTLLDRSAVDAERGLEVIARRPRGMTHDALLHALQPLMIDYAAREPADRNRLRMAVGPVEGTPAGKQMSITLPWVLGVASLLTLLIACANVAILMIARWTARAHEISIRASLGASRARLVRALVTESIAVAVCGGALGVGSAYALLAAILMRAGTPDFLNVSVDPLVLAQSAAATLAAGLLVGIGPALIETRRLHGSPMRVNALTEPLRQRWRHALVVLEIAVTVGLLVVASALVGGYRRALGADMGFQTRPMMSARAELPKGVAVGTPLEALAAVPGVAAAAASTTVPLTASGPRVLVGLDANGAGRMMAERGDITPSFFTVLDVAIRKGRSFTAADADTARVAIVNEAFERKLPGGARAEGARIWLDGAAFEIVGVAANFANRQFFRDHEPRVFLPMAPGPGADRRRVAFVVRAKGDPAPLVQPVRRAIRDSAAGSVVTSGFTFDEIKAVGGQEILVGTAPLVPLILIGMLLTTAGIYGVLAFAVARRSRELAVRLAIGATEWNLARLVAAHTVRLFAIGSAGGVGLTFALARVIRASGGAGSPFDADWTAFVLPVAVVGAVAALATWVPARRVRKIDPAVLLRV